MIFKNREDAGKKLLEKLQEYKKKSDVIVLALPRGGVVLAYEIAMGLKAPLDLIIPQKIGAPDFPEFAIGAITEDEVFLNEDVISSYGISREYIEKEVEKKKKEAARRAALYRKGLGILKLKDKIVLLVDDGIATGATVLVSIKSVKSKNPKKIVVVAPVIAPDSVKKIEKQVDEVVYISAPDGFSAVGEFYEEFDQVEDDQVIDLMKKAYEKK